MGGGRFKFMFTNMNKPSYILKSDFFYVFRSNMLIKAQGLNKDSGFVKEDNSGRSNVFSTGEKALYSSSPTAEKAARQGLGGILGLSIVAPIAALVAIATVSISTDQAPLSASNIDLTNLDSLSKISSRLKK